MKRLGKIKSSYPKLKKNGDLAELIGVVLGDGHIGIFPRVESLLIFSNSNNLGFVARYSELVEKVFMKKPRITEIKGAQCIKISIYQKQISNRLGVPAGSRKNVKNVMPSWILKNRQYMIRYLRGLYEAEGSFSVHKPTSTYKLSFANRNPSLLQQVYLLLKDLGFHPSRDDRRIQLSRKEEVYKAKDLFHFREY